MNQKLLFFFAFFLLTVNALAITISGTVRDTKKQPIPGANIYIKDSYDGGTSNASGLYSFTTDIKGAATLVCSFIGYEQVEIAITLSGEDQKLDIILKEKSNELNTVVISAGTIEASDEKRTTVLKPLDIVTTAGSAGDIFGALQTLPGTQRVGDQEGLFVRGGAGTEAKTIIDGMIVNNPFFTGIQDVAARGRFSPFLFKGTVFSTGGYSAQYGQALSSVLVLETQDLPDRTSSTLAVSSVGLGAGHNHLWDKKGFSAGADLNYTNLQPYFALVPQIQKFTRGPEYIGGSANFRKKIGETGILKFYGYANFNNLEFPLVTVNDTTGTGNPFALSNQNIYTNLSWRQYVNKWRLDAAASWSHNFDDIRQSFNNIPSSIKSTADLSQGRIMATRYFMLRNQLRVGAEYQYIFDKLETTVFRGELIDNYVSGFTEADIFLNSKIVFRSGLRAENSSQLQSTRLAPRISLAAKTGENSQLSFAYGDFYQKPLRDYLLFSPSLNHEKATHYIISFQQVTDSITFRIEAYYKTYAQLTKLDRNLPYTAYENTGNGFARGFDVFWRDKKTFRNVDYWISYTFLDSERDYLDYTNPAQPVFATKHNASLVFKKFFPRFMTSFGFSYFYASGRPYFNPNNPVFLGDKTYDYHSLNINASYLTRIFGAFTVIAVSVTNVTGFNQVFSYRYSDDGLRRQTIGPPAPRSFFIGMFMSFGQDRSREVINNNN
jgi:vitamin B12 transporter